MNFLVQYQFGDNRGNIRVNADDEEQAKAKAKKKVTELSTLAMAYTNFIVIKQD